MGAPEMPPVEPIMADSGLARTAGAAGGACDKLDTDFEGEKCDMAEPGRVVPALVVMARFCASIASRTLGFEVPIVLFDKPRPGRAPPSGFLGDLGLLGSFWMGASMRSLTLEPRRSDVTATGPTACTIDMQVSVYTERTHKTER